MAEKIKQELRKLTRSENFIVKGVLLASILILAIFINQSIQATQIGGYGYGYGYDYGYGYGYWTESNPSLAITYSHSGGRTTSPFKAGTLTITATFGSAPAGTPQVAVDQAGTTDISATNMTSTSNSAVWTYAYTVTAATGGTYQDGTATVTITTLQGLGFTPTPTGNTFTIDTTAPSAPSSSPAAGTYVGTQSVSLSAAEGTIYYTTDASTPTSSSTQYSAAFNVSTTTTVKAIAVDTAGNESSVMSSAYTITSGGVGVVAPAGPAAPAAEAPVAKPVTPAPTVQIPGIVSIPVPVAELTVPVKPAVRSLAIEQVAIKEVAKIIGKAPTTAVEWKVNDFIAYGATKESVKAGLGERIGVISDYRAVFGTIPQTANDWQDVQKILTGHKPARRDLADEKSAIITFKQIYGRDPGTAKTKLDKDRDWWVVNYITYSIRPPVRSMVKERAAIGIFKGIFGKAPKVRVEWNILRAIAYTGAKKAK